MAELSAGPHATDDPDERARRRMADLLIAATALAEGLPLYTRNADDFGGLVQILPINSV